jgi:Zn-dependent peptidase ImmA (M78 family)
LSNEDRGYGAVFSLFHEVSHLCAGSPGASGILTHKQTGYGWVQELERYCDDVAAAYLMPIEEPAVRAALRDLAGDFSLGTAKRVAGRLKVSKYAAARRVLENGLIDEGAYWDTVNEWRSLDAVMRPDPGGGDYNRTQVSQAGKRFVDVVITAVDRELITSVEGSAMVGVSASVIEGMVERGVA